MTFEDQKSGSISNVVVLKTFVYFKPHVKFQSWVRKWVSALMFTLYQIWFWFLEPDFENQRFQCNFESLQLPWPEGPPTGGATGTTSTGGRKYKSRRSLFVSILCNLIGPRCLCQISLASCAVVLDAGPLLEPPVPPLVRLPVVRDAGPLLEPLVPPLVRLRAGGPAGQCRTGGAHRTLWFLLSKKTWLLSTKKSGSSLNAMVPKTFWASLCVDLTITNFWQRHRAPRRLNFEETRKFSIINFSRVCVASKICHYSITSILCKVWFHWFTSRKHMFLLIMHRALYSLVRRAPVTTIKCTICICANVSLRGITVYSAGWGIFRKPCFCNYSGCSNGPSNVPKREHVSHPKRDRERECENAFIFESEVFRRFAFFEFWKIDRINVSKKVDVVQNRQFFEPQN